MSEWLANAFELLHLDAGSDAGRELHEFGIAGHCFRAFSVLLRKRLPVQSSVLDRIAEPPFLC